MAQMADLKNTDTKELGEAVDMIKDLAEAIYYCTITEAMEKKEEDPQKRETHYYSERIREPYYPYPPREQPMFYGGNNNGGAQSGNNSSGGSNSNNGGSRSYFQEKELPIPEMRDPREGKSYISRRMYMESKEMGKDKASNIQDLDNYMNELGSDITEMIRNSSVEEKQMLQHRLNMLAQKIMNG